MIIVQLDGGLGNQLFQYAAARRLGLTHKVPVKLDVSCYTKKGTIRRLALNHFKIDAGIASSWEILAVSPWFAVDRFVRYGLGGSQSVLWAKILRKLRVRSPGAYRIFEYDVGRPMPDLLIHGLASERCFHFDPEILSLPDNLVLQGFWQNEKYFAEIAPIIRQELQVVHPLEGRNLTMAEQIQSSESISLHVRRGDKVGARDFSPTDLGYCQDAMNFFRGKLAKPHFFVFSDGWDWVKTHIPAGADVTHVDHNDDVHDYEDLRLMALCKHNIIAPSSFSWWGAWLNPNPEKIVVSPSPREWTKIANFVTDDLLPPEWIVLKHPSV